LLAAVLNNNQIAEKLSLSIRTVNAHRKNILAKTDKVIMSEFVFNLLIQGVL